ncbi:FHA domain protein [Dictyocaulus viviparus]|uniref:FHA domain protein n=1 Tax=Dictyocaulus viviparus TaxID=29172 RepID=A0A0D8XN35_DICVI|nr:FHA domain protein [Dictyocaulus viviparus]
MHGPYVVLSPISKSHPFEERRAHVGPDDDPLKIGRAVARLKAAKDNAIFDCKVLSRNHAVLSYRNGGFFLRDTKSSNGTFVNNERLAVTGEESEARQIFSGDIVQFGVEIVENTNKVAHGCIYAMVQLYDASGQMVEGGTMGKCEMNSILPSSEPSLVNNQQLFQIQQYLSEALYREGVCRQKLEALEKVLEVTEHASEAAWKAIVNEDRLLSRIETLEAQLATFSKSATPEKLREKILVLFDDIAKFELTSKEHLRRAQEERAEAALRLADIDRSLVSTEEECNRLRSRVHTLESRLSETVKAYEIKANECSMSQAALIEAEKRLAAAEEQAGVAEARQTEVEIQSQHERSISSLIRLLINALNSNPCLNEDDHWLTTLYDILRERNGIPDAVLEPPVIKSPKFDRSSDEVICSKCEYINDLNTREALIRSEMESHLKENLQLKARVRDLETSLAVKVTPMYMPEKGCLELDALHSVSTAPAQKMAIAQTSMSAVVTDQFCALDRFQNTIFIISLAPFLAIILLVLAPLHSRFMQYVKQE